MPASDMMLAFSPMQYMGMKASATDTGMVTMGTMADGHVPQEEQDDEARR